MSSLDELLERLEASIGMLNEGTAPLEDLVRAHEEAARVVEMAERELARVTAWSDKAVPPGDQR